MDTLFIFTYIPRRFRAYYLFVPTNAHKEVKQSRYRPGVAQRLPGS